MCNDICKNWNASASQDPVTISNYYTFHTLPYRYKPSIANGRGVRIPKSYVSLDIRANFSISVLKHPGIHKYLPQNQQFF